MYILLYISLCILYISFIYTVPIPRVLIFWTYNLSLITTSHILSHVTCLYPKKDSQDAPLQDLFSLQGFDISKLELKKDGGKFSYGDLNHLAGLLEANLNSKWRPQHQSVGFFCERVASGIKWEDQAVLPKRLHTIVWWYQGIILKCNLSSQISFHF